MAVIPNGMLRGAGALQLLWFPDLHLKTIIKYD